MKGKTIIGCQILLDVFLLKGENIFITSHAGYASEIVFTK